MKKLALLLTAAVAVIVALRVLDRIEPRAAEAVRPEAGAPVESTHEVGTGALATVASEPADATRTVAPARRTITDDGTTEAPAATETEHEAPTAELEVHLVAVETGAPLVGRYTAVTVVGEGAPDTPSPAVSTDGLGVAVHEVPAGRPLRLTIARLDAPNEARTVGILDPGERRRFAVELTTAEVVRASGRVIDAADGTPVAGARVHAWQVRPPGRERSGEQSSETVESAVDGSFSLELRAAVLARLRVVASGYAERRLVLYDGKRAPAEGVVVRLELGATLELRVVEDGGRPLEAATVRLATSGSHLDAGGPLFVSMAADDVDWVAETDPSGACRFTDLPPAAPLELALDGWPDLGLEPFVLEPGETRRETVRLERGIALTGTLVDESGEPVTGVGMWIDRAEDREPGAFARWDVPFDRAETDEDGRFAFGDVHPGPWRVGPRPSEADRPGRVAPLFTVVEVLPGSPDLDVVVRTHRGLFVSGRVLDPDGEPVGGGLVMFSGGGGRGMKTTGDDGSFRVGPLAPGSYELTPWPSVIHGAHAPGEPVPVRAGEEGVVLVLQRGGRVRARVLAPDGGGALAGIVLSCDDPEVLLMTEAEDDFVLEGLAPGTYGLSATTNDGQVGVVSGIVVAPDRATEVELLLEPGTRLAVRRAPGGERARLRIRSDGVVVVADSLQAGATRTFVVPIGPLVVQVWRGDEREEVDVVARRGEQNRVALE